MAEPDTTTKRRRRAAGVPAGAKATIRQEIDEIVAATPAQMLEVVRYIDVNVLVERALELRVMLLAALSGTNVHLIGAPGTGKSLANRQFAKCITGANYFEKVLHAQTPADAIVGGYDMDLFAKGGGLVRKTEGYMPWAHIVFLDELPRANGPTLDATLPMMNVGERLAEHNGGMNKTGIIFVTTGSNTWFDADNTQAQALADRVTLMCMVSPIRSDESYKEMIRRDHARRQDERRGEVERPTVTLEQLQGAVIQVNAITPTPEYLDADAQLRREARGKGLIVSDRRWVELGQVARAGAWLAGRDHLIPDDNAHKEYGLWREETDIPKAAELVEQWHGRFVREAREKRTEAAKSLARLEQIRPQVEGTPPNQDLEPDVLKTAINIGRAIDAVKARVEAVLAEAEKEKRDAADLRDLDNELLAAQKWVKANGLPTTYTGD